MAKLKTTNPKPEAAKEVEETAKTVELRTTILAALDPFQKPTEAAKEVEETAKTVEPVIKTAELSGPKRVCVGYGPQPCNLELHPAILQAAGLWPRGKVLIECRKPGEIIIRKFEPEKLGAVEKEQLKRRGA